MSGRWVTCNDTDISFTRSDLTVQTKDNTVYLYKRLTNVSQKPDEYQIIEYGRDDDLAEKDNESYKSVQNGSKSQKISKEALVSSNVAIQNNSKRKHNTSPESKILHTSKEKEQSEIFEDSKIGLGKHSKRMKPDTSKDNIVIGSNDNIEHTLNISKENTKDDNIEKGSSTKTTRKRKTNGSPQTCEGIADKFSVESILKSIEINPNDSKSNDDLLSEEEDLLCKGCGKKFQRLLAHLKRSSPCGSYHDIDEMTRKANERRKEQKRKSQEKAWASKTESEKNKRRVQDKEQTAKARASKADDAEKRRKLFHRAVKYGPVFVCLCCHRKLFENNVKPIPNIEGFIQKLDEKDIELFNT